jgi:hypothetical protein
MSNDIEKREGSFTGEAGDGAIRTTEAAASVQADAGRRVGRRGFLAGAGVAGAGVAAAALAARPSPSQAPGNAASAKKDAPPEAGRGYHETAHVRKYYDTTKV